MYCLLFFVVASPVSLLFCFFFFNDTATTEIYTLSLHDALPIWALWLQSHQTRHGRPGGAGGGRSEEHTSELQSRVDIVCRLLLEKKKKTQKEYLKSNYKTTTTSSKREKTTD